MNVTMCRCRRCLFTGATIVVVVCALNAVVAVLCALWSPTGSRLTITSSQHRGWPARVPEGWPSMDSFGRWSGFGLDYEAVSMSNLVGHPVSFSAFNGFSGEGSVACYEVACVRVGWPWRSFASTRIAHSRYEGDIANAPITALQAPWRGAIVVDAGWTGASPTPGFARILPFRPLLRGFALNCMVYAGCLLVILGTHRFVRGRWRRSRGRCAGCGYDCRGLHACPECGPGADLADTPARLVQHLGRFDSTTTGQHGVACFAASPPGSSSCLT